MDLSQVQAIADEHAQRVGWKTKHPGMRFAGVEDIARAIGSAIIQALNVVGHPVGSPGQDTTLQTREVMLSALERDGRND